MDIKLLYNFYALNGAYTSFNDLYYNLQSLTKHKISWYNFYDYKEAIIQNRRFTNNNKNVFYFPSVLHRACREDKLFHYDLSANWFIISVEIITLILRGVLTLHTSNPLLLYYPAFIFLKENIKEQNNYKEIMDFINSNNVLVICNKYNSQYVSNFIQYDIKLSPQRINMLSQLCTNTNKVLTSEDYYHNKGKIDVYSYQQYYYYRYDKKNDSNEYIQARYYENIGKLMFEFLLFNKKAYYCAKNKPFDDGLTDMLHRFDIDDNYDYDLTIIPKKYLEDILYMKSNDDILQLLR